MKLYNEPKIELCALDMIDLITSSISVLSADDGDDWNVGAWLSDLDI